jgi:hypothetical protein
MQQTAMPLPNSGRLAAWAAAFRDAVDRSRFLMPLAVYTAFALLIYALQGSEPPLSIDHVSYFKLADDIRTSWQSGDYWRSYNAVTGYGVLLAYMYDYTGSHVASLKLLLVAMTVAFLWSFQGFMSLVTPRRSRAMLFAILSALFVTFGASIWGMTDFSASLNRTVIMPLVILLVWFFFRYLDSPWRYAALPGFILLSLLHLSALHVFLVFCAFEVVDFAVRRRFRFTRDIPAFIVAVLLSLVMQAFVEGKAGSGGFVRYTLQMTLPSLAEMLPNPQAKEAAKPTMKVVEVATARGGVVTERSRPVTGVNVARGEGGVGLGSGAHVLLEPVAGPNTLATTKRMSNRDAWRIELMAFPWRNFPPSIATIATIISSYGVILLLALWGVVRVFRSGEARPADRAMVALAGGVVLAAFGLQFALWLLRDLVPVFPINFEEIRAINMLMVPSIYFVYRLYESAPLLGRLSPRAVRVTILAAFALQPIMMVKAMPASWREGMIDTAVSNGLLKTSDAPRMLYARQFLGLADEGRRFYYSTLPLLEWLERNIGPDERVLTNLDALYGTRIKAVGPFLQIVTMDVWDPRRADWARSVELVDEAMRAKDLGRVFELAEKFGASYAVVDWPVSDSVYNDAYFWVVRVPEPEPDRGVKR